MTKLYTYQQSPSQGQIVIANPESTYTVSNYPYGQGGTYSGFVQSGGKVTKIDPYRMAYYARNWSGNNPAFAAFICCRGASEGTYVGFWVTNLVCKVGYGLSHNTETGGPYLQTDGYSDKYFYLYGTELSSYSQITVNGTTVKNITIKSVLGEFRIADIESKLDYLLDMSDDPTPGYSTWVEGRLYDLSSLFASTTFNKVVESPTRINLRGLHNFYNRQHALDDVAYLKRSDLTSDNVLVLTKSQLEEYNLLTTSSIIPDSQIQSVSASKLSGEVPFASIPRLAIERVHSVADETARFALTSSEVHEGDVIHQQDDHSQYYVIDATKLNSADGYKKITKVALEVPWTGLTDKPVYFQPATHSHGNITDDGYLGETANLPLITGSSGTITAGSFGNAANTFCEGNDSRLSDAREPLNYGTDKITALTGYAVSDGSTQSSSFASVYYSYWYPTQDQYNKALYVVSNKFNMINPYALYSLGADSYESIYYSSPSWAAAQINANTAYFEMYAASNISIDVGQEFPGYGRSYGTGNKTLVHKGYSTEVFWVYRTNNNQIVTDVWGPFNISDVDTYKDIVPSSIDLPSQHKIDVASYNDSYVQVYITRPDPSQVAAVVTKIYIAPVTGAIQATDNLNQALGKLVNNLSRISGAAVTMWSSYEKVDYEPITTEDTYATAIGKLESDVTDIAVHDDIDGMF